MSIMENNMHNKFTYFHTLSYLCSKLRDEIKQTRDQQRRAQSANSRVMHDAIAEEINQSFRMVAQDFLKKGKGQGGGLARAGAGAGLSDSKDKRLYEDLKKIQELNSFMKVQSPPKGGIGRDGRSLSPKREEEMKQEFLQDMTSNPFSDEPIHMAKPQSPTRAADIMKEMGFGN